MSAALLPEEIVFNIFTRLPVKSICLCKCVCKTWLSIISAQPFVDFLSARSKSQPKLLVAIYRGKPRRFLADPAPERHLFIADPVPEQDEDGSSVVVVLRQSVTMPTITAGSCLVGDLSPGDSQSLGGLMFSLCSLNLIHVANPSTNKCVAFSRQNYSPSHRDRDNTYRYVSLGFDPVEGKHKLLESISILNHSLYHSDRVERTEHRVITIGDDRNCWRYVDGPTICRGECGGQEICINGVIYCTAWVNGQRCLVAFDVRTESFQAVNLSMKGRFNHSPYPWRYVEFEGKVAIVDYPLSNRDCCYEAEDCEHALELWVLEDFQKQVWSLKFAALPPLPMETDDMINPTHKLVGTTHDGELIFAVFEKGSYYGTHIRKVTEEEKGVPFSFLFFDMKTGDFRSSKVRFPEGFALTGHIKITAMGHVETLLSI